MEEKKSKKIKVRTYEDMFFTVDIVSNEHDAVKRIQELAEELNNNTVLYLPLENKIINTREVKETLIGY